jgi:hypothetical protein
MQTNRRACFSLPKTCVSLLVLLLLIAPSVGAATPKVHTVTLGPVRRVPYTPPEATADNKSEEATTLRVRAMFVDDRQKEWTVGEMHEVTDRTFVIRRALRINDSLPGESARWTWQPGPWLMVDRVTGHVTALHLPAFDPDISEAVWFRDYAAYCGIAQTVKGGLVVVIAEVGSRKAVVQKVIGPWPIENPPHPVCLTPRWQRTPIRATLQATGGPPLTYDVVGTTSLVEEGDPVDN